MAGKSTDVAERPAAVPALAYQPQMDIGSEDVALPRIHMAQYSSKAFMNDLVDKGVLYSSVGQEDPDPVTLTQPMKFYVLGMKKAKSYSEGSGAPLERYEFSDPDAPAGAWVTYDYTICVPDEDTEVPFKILLTKSGRPAAQQMNTILIKTANVGPPWTQAFELTTEARENTKGKYFVPRVRHVEADADGVALAATLAATLAERMSPQAADIGSTGEQPNI